MQTSPIANPVTKRNIDDLEEEIISLAKHMNQDEYRFLVMVANSISARDGGPINLTTAPNGSI